jgi:hypothetical protein
MVRMGVGGAAVEAASAGAKLAAADAGGDTSDRLLSNTSPSDGVA